MPFLAVILGISFCAAVYADDNDGLLNEIFRDDFNHSGVLDSQKWIAGCSDESSRHFRNLANVPLVKNGSLGLPVHGFPGTDWSASTTYLFTTTFELLYGEIEMSARVLQSNGSSFLGLRTLCSNALCQGKEFWQMGFPFGRPSGCMTAIVAGGKPFRNQTVCKPNYSDDPGLSEYIIFKLSWRANAVVFTLNGEDVFNITDKYYIPSILLRPTILVTIPSEYLYVPTLRFRQRSMPRFFVDYVTVTQEVIPKDPWGEYGINVVLPAALGSVLGILIISVVVAAAFIYWQRRKAASQIDGVALKKSVSSGTSLESKSHSRPVPPQLDSREKVQKTVSFQVAP